MDPSSTPPPASQEHPRDLGSLTAIVAALVTCQHPPAARVGAHLRLFVIGEPSPVTWCGACGAISPDDPLGRWGPPALVGMLTPALLEPLSELLHAVARTARESDAQFGPLAPLAQTSLVGDVHRLDDAIAIMQAQPV